MNIVVKTNSIVKKQHNFWNGLHFHPTDAIEDDWGKQILDSIAADGVADMVRMYAMLEDIVTLDENGQLVFDFTATNLRLDYMVSKGFRIFLSYNFMPACIAKDPEAVRKGRYKGKTICTSPPRDYALWEEVCYRYTSHIIERYGMDILSGWYLQCWNEPDLGAFFMQELASFRADPSVTAIRLGEYLKLYRHFAAGVSRACPALKIGGPSLDADMVFLEGFLKSVKKEHIKLDFVGIHTYGTGTGRLNDGTKPFHTDNTIEIHREHQEIIDRYFPGIEIIIDEWGACGAGFASLEQCPALLFRETSAYAAYTGKLVARYIETGLPVSKMLMCLSGQHQTTKEFSGYRSMISLNYVKKPVYNAYVLLGKLGENILFSEHTTENLTVLATSHGSGKLSVMLAYAPECFDRKLPSMSAQLHLDGISGFHHIRTWRIDDNHTNPYSYAQAHSISDTPAPEELAMLREEGTLIPYAEYDIDLDAEKAIPVEFDNNALVLVEIE